MATRSFISVVSATRQPSPSPPSRSASGTRASVKKTSLNSASPVIWKSGRTSTPGACMSTRNAVMPRCFGWSGSVRARRRPKLARWATVVQTFWPFRTHSSPSRTARVARPATSEPAPGSLNSWHQISSHVNSGRRYRCCWRSVPWATSVGATMPRPMMLHRARERRTGLEQRSVTRCWRPGLSPSRPVPPGSGPTPVRGRTGRRGTPGRRLCPAGSRPAVRRRARRPASSSVDAISPPLRRVDAGSVAVVACVRHVAPGDDVHVDAGLRGEAEDLADDRAAVPSPPTGCAGWRPPRSG